MSKNHKVWQWLFQLFIILILFILGLSFIFLFRPQIFVDDIEMFIENQLSSSISGKVDIGHFEGNFIEGFTLRNLQYVANDTIILSAGNIYIDPDLSNLAFGNIVFSKVVLNNLDIQFSDLSAGNPVIEFKRNLYPLNIIISS